MIHRLLATDYDGTLAQRGQVAPEVVSALERARAAGLRLVLVTGRVVPELRQVFPRIDLFDRVVAENGGLLLDPERGAERLLADPPPARLVRELRRRGVEPLDAGRVVLATWRPRDETAAEVIQELGLSHRVVLNKRAVMILPEGVDKASGVAACLADLGIRAYDTVGIGDAENDLAFLAECGFACAVANALPEVKRAVDLVTSGEAGAGVVELIDALLAESLPSRSRRTP